MSDKPFPKANPMDAFQSVWYRLGLLVWIIVIPLSWFTLGPSNPFYAVMVVWATSSLEPVLAVPMMPRVPRQWFRVPARERALHRIVGVGIFGRLLDVCGWNRLIKPMRGFPGTRAGLLSLEQHARTGAIAHGICFAIHVLLAALALSSKHTWRGALWMLLPGVIVHLYPLLLQRSIMLRTQPLLDKIAPVDQVEVCGAPSIPPRG